MKLEKLLTMKAYEVINETSNSIFIKSWNCRKPERFYFGFMTKEKILKVAQQTYDNAVKEARENLARFNQMELETIVSYIVGYNCTLHQFAKLVKRTEKTLIFQKFEYQGMSCTAKPHDLINEFIRVPAHKIRSYTEYNPAITYYNNED